MSIQEINQASPYLEQVIALGDAHSTTLGFLPRKAFEEHAAKKHILIALEDNQQLAGYLLYRISHQRATIVHLCVAPRYQRKGIAKKLVKALCERTQYLSGIRISCRRDYEVANKVWPQIGFVPLWEKPGRGKDGHILTIWQLDYDNPTLFSIAAQDAPTTKIRVVIDANVFFDLQVDEESAESKESQALLADWLQEEMEIFVTDELKVEINRNQKSQQRECQRAFAQRFSSLAGRPEEIEKTLEKLERLFPEQTKERDHSDRRQLARTIVNDVLFFVTRDDKLLRRQEDLYKEFGLTVIRPSDLIVHLDELQRAAEYRPERLAGTSLEIRRVQPAEQDNIWLQFQCQSQQETKTQFRQKLQQFLAHPTRYESYVTLGEDQRPLAIFVYDTDDTDILEIPLFRVYQGSLAATLARYLLSQFLIKASQNQKAWTRVTDPLLGDTIKGALQETAFVHTDGKWTKLTLAVADTAQQLAHRLKAHGVQIAEPCNTFAELLDKKDAITDTLTMLEIERMLWPAKIVDADIPNYLVPIRSQWANKLFDEQFAKETLFGAPEVLMLKRENVYYRSARPGLERGRILWYVSKDTRHQWTGGVRACSYIDEVVVGKPKELFRKFRRIGIYTWKNVFDTAKKDLDKTIMALQFSNTELFVNPISLETLRKIFSEVGEKFQPPLGPRSISKDLFARLYRTGNGLE